jgi:hypothetical protein
MPNLNSDSWLERVGYKLSGEKVTLLNHGLNGASACGQAPSSRKGPTTVDPPTNSPASTQGHFMVVRPSWIDRIITLSNPVLASVPTALMAIYFFGHHQPIEHGVDPATRAQTIAVKVEREADEVTAHERAKKISAAASGLESSWNQGGSRFTFGRVVKVRQYYLPLPRPGFESQFSDMEFDGFSRIKLYEIYVPRKWDEHLLYLHKYLWAASCNINHEWIDEFSSFRPGPMSEPVNECHASGVCIIVSQGCRGDTFDDVN